VRAADLIPILGFTLKDGNIHLSHKGKQYPRMANLISMIFENNSMLYDKQTNLDMIFSIKDEIAQSDTESFFVISDNSIGSVSIYDLKNILSQAGLSARQQRIVVLSLLRQSPNRVMPSKQGLSFRAIRIFIGLMGLKIYCWETSEIYFIGK